MKQLRISLLSKILSISILSLAISCTSDDSKPKIDASDTPESGAITIDIDESYKPIMEQQIKVFDSSYPNANITANYLPQEACFEDLLSNKVRLIITARDLNAAEKEYCAKNKINIRSLSIADDAIAVIVNNDSPDSLMTLGILQNILRDSFPRKYDVVFDNKKSGIVRYVLDSLIFSKDFPSNAYALQTNDSVIQYVAANKNAIGFIGVSHLYDPEDGSGQGHFKNNVKVVAIQDDSTRQFNQPYQAYIALQQYPLRRTLYFHLREEYRGLGTGFVNFLSTQRGQTIFHKEFLVPTRVPLNIRETVIKQ